MYNFSYRHHLIKQISYLDFFDFFRSCFILIFHFEQIITVCDNLSKVSVFEQARIPLSIFQGQLGAKPNGESERIGRLTIIKSSQCFIF